jgi:hypothetical protein
MIHLLFGRRALAFKARKEVRLISGNQINFGNDYPQLIDFLKFRGEIIEMPLNQVPSLSWLKIKPSHRCSNPFESMRGNTLQAPTSPYPSL